MSISGISGGNYSSSPPPNNYAHLKSQIASFFDSSQVNPDDPQPSAASLYSQIQQMESNPTVSSRDQAILQRLSGRVHIYQEINRVVSNVESAIRSGEVSPIVGHMQINALKEEQENIANQCSTEIEGLK